ncbi:MAG: response regulator transcription factor [Aquaticitalea sp.]
MIKVAIVDDNTFLQKVIIDKLSFFEDIVVKFKANNGEDLISKLEKNHNIHLILMDIEMPKMNGIDAAQYVKTNYPQIKIIMLTVFDNEENIFKSIKAGADGYLLKEVSPEELQKAIVDTLNGGAVMTPTIALKTLKLFRESSTVKDFAITEDYNLTSREIEVLEQLSKGLKYHAIAENLFLSKGTIRKHVDNIYSKLQVHSRLEAIQKVKNSNLL